MQILVSTRRVQTIKYVHAKESISANLLMRNYVYVKSVFKNRVCLKRDFVLKEKKCVLGTFAKN